MIGGCCIVNAAKFEYCELKLQCKALLWPEAHQQLKMFVSLCFCMSSVIHLGSAVVQASHHRVRLWHATKEIYQNLSDSSVHSDPIHLFPGQTPRKVAVVVAAGTSVTMPAATVAAAVAAAAAAAAAVAAASIFCIRS